MHNRNAKRDGAFALFLPLKLHLVGCRGWGDDLSHLLKAPAYFLYYFTIFLECHWEGGGGAPREFLPHHQRSQ
jgi:hypothetical protein